jgi:hypothetical protein
LRRTGFPVLAINALAVDAAFLARVVAFAVFLHAETLFALAFPLSLFTWTVLCLYDGKVQDLITERHFFLHDLVRLGCLVEAILALAKGIAFPIVGVADAVEFLTAGLDALASVLGHLFGNFHLRWGQGSVGAEFFSLEDGLRHDRLLDTALRLVEPLAHHSLFLLFEIRLYKGNGEIVNPS